ncbi:MAG TPA: Gfo/Idh/MocA family oxidoreductase [Armatimonadota bacterium]|nr:Gfo/Idh/MocA family oxidoreductase [Armatimonadota bacterium]
METVRIGMAGLGSWGKNVVRCFSRAKGAELRAICDGDAGKLAVQAGLYPDATPVTDFQALLDDPELEAIALATPAPTHFALGMRALEAGKHLFVEKPMTLSAADAETLCATAERLGRTLMVGHLLEYHPAVDWMKTYLDSGALGAPLYLYSQRLNLGTVRPDENALWSLAPHDISVILYLFGAMPESVAAHGEDFLQPGIEDVVFVYLRFPDGRAGQIHISWLDPHKERKMVLVGAQTMVVFDDMAPMETLRVYNKGAVLPESPNRTQVTVRHGDVLIPHVNAGEPLQTECQHFIDAIRTHTPPRSDGRDGLRVVRILEAADRSLKQGGVPVMLETAVSR